MALSHKERSTVTREAILDSAQHLFARNGVSRTSLDRIAQHANVSRGAIYAHFRNKDEVFQAVLNRAWQPVCESLLNFAETGNSSMLNTLHAAIVSIVRSIGTNPRSREVTEILLNKSEFVNENSPAIDCVRSNAERTISSITRALQQGIQKDELSKDIDVKVVTQLIHSQLSGIVHDVLRHPDLSPLDNCIQGIDALFLLIAQRYSKFVADGARGVRLKTWTGLCCHSQALPVFERA